MADNQVYTKDELLSALREELRRWEEMLSMLTQAQLVQRDLPAGLSVKDVVAHLWAWQGLSVARLEAALDSRDPEYDLGPDGLDPDNEQNLQSINAWIHKTNLARPWMEVYSNWRGRFLRFVELAQRVPDESLMRPARYPWLKDAALSAVVRGSYEHHHVEHYEPLIAALSARGVEFPD